MKKFPDDNFTRFAIVYIIIATVLFVGSFVAFYREYQEEQRKPKPQCTKENLVTYINQMDSVASIEYREWSTTIMIGKSFSTSKRNNGADIRNKLNKVMKVQGCDTATHNLMHNMHSAVGRFDTATYTQYRNEFVLVVYDIRER